MRTRRKAYDCEDETSASDAQGPVLAAARNDPSAGGHKSDPGSRGLGMPICRGIRQFII